MQVEAKCSKIPKKKKKLTLEEKRRQFAIRNKMVGIPAMEETICFCGKIENINHIYECEMFLHFWLYTSMPNM